MRIVASGQRSCKNKRIHVWLESDHLILTVCLNTGAKMLDSLRRWSGSVPGSDSCEVLTARDKGGRQGPAVLFPVLLPQWLQAAHCRNCICLVPRGRNTVLKITRGIFPPYHCVRSCVISPCLNFSPKEVKTSSPSSLPGCRAEL